MLPSLPEAGSPESVDEGLHMLPLDFLRIRRLAGISQPLRQRPEERIVVTLVRHEFVAEEGGGSFRESQLLIVHRALH